MVRFYSSLPRKTRNIRIYFQKYSSESSPRDDVLTGASRHPLPVSWWRPPRLDLRVVLPEARALNASHSLNFARKIHIMRLMYEGPVPLNEVYKTGTQR